MLRGIAFFGGVLPIPEHLRGRDRDRRKSPLVARGMAEQRR
jgi:hypothetical protein